MKQLTICKIAAAQPRAERLPALFDEAGVPFEAIDCVNWSDYPYAPKVEFRMAYTDHALLLHYRVEEEAVRAEARMDNGRVWEDSCVEFFSVPAADGIYYNMECNCVGRLLIGAGAEREGRSRAPQEVIDRVDRWCSLGREDFDLRPEPCAWQVALVIPVEAYFLHRITATAELGKIRANFYKCGDRLPRPHFLSWNAIDLPKPDFHVPPFFGEVVLG